MASDLSQDPRFIELPQKWKDEIAKHPPTGIKGEDTWHEVQFIMGGIMCQCAVVNGGWVALDRPTVDQFEGILKIWKASEL